MLGPGMAVTVTGDGAADGRRGGGGRAGVGSEGGAVGGRTSCDTHIAPVVSLVQIPVAAFQTPVSVEKFSFNNTRGWAEPAAHAKAKIQTFSRVSMGSEDGVLL